MIDSAAPRTLRDLLLDRAASDPDALAFDDGRRRVTYGQLTARAAGKAARLADLGVHHGDRVALALPAGVDWAEAFWAAQLVGAATCAFNPHVPPDVLAGRAARVRPRLVVHPATFDGVGPADDIPPEPPVGPEDVACLQPTSGTYGDPRAAMLLHRTLLAYLAADDHEWAHPGDVFVDWVPPWHDYGLVRFMIGGVAHGVPCHIVEPAVRTLPRYLERVTEVRGTVIGGPDFAFRLAARMVDPRSVDISSVRSAGNGGEPVSASTVHRFEEAFGVSGVVQPGYGLAEATLGVSMHPAGEPLIVDARGNVALGPLRAGLEARVEGDLHEPGEILLRGDAIFAGYLDAPADTAAALRDGWLHTGDLGYMEDGLLYVLGRRRAMIKRAGGLVAPRELEEAALGVPGVRLAAAVGLPDRAQLTETAVVAVEDERAHSSEAGPLAAEIARAVTHAAGFAPGEVVVVPPRSIPLTANGKVRHGRLRELLLQGLFLS
ncbi:MAG: class I adenylate-forming enzyme family protein [Thermoleophilaceae bacterium]